MRETIQKIQKRSLLPTLNELWSLVSSDPVFQKAYDGQRFLRLNKIQLIFPDEFSDKFAGRTLSYTSWFLNRDKRAMLLQNQLGMLLNETTYIFLGRMTAKCHALIYPGPQAAIKKETLDAMLERVLEAGTFPAGEVQEQYLRLMTEHAPARALATIMLISALGEMRPEICGLLSAFWKFTAEIQDDATVASMLNDHYSAGELLFDRGLYHEAFLEFEKAAASGKAGSMKEVTALYKIGISLFGGNGYARDITAAREFLQKSADLNYGPAFYPLYQACMELNDPDVALITLERGASLHQMNCIRALAGACYHGTAPVYKVNLYAAFRLYQMGASPSLLSKGDSQCQYMSGIILESHPELSSDYSAVYWLKMAAENGDKRAEKHLMHLTQKSPMPAGQVCPAAVGPAMCLTNSTTKEAMLFIESLPANFAEVTLFTCEADVAGMPHSNDGLFCRYPGIDKIVSTGSIRECIQTFYNGSCTDMVFLFLSDYESKNVEDTFTVISSVRDASNDSTGSSDRLKRISVYIRYESSSCIELLDNEFSMLTDISIQLHYMNYGEMASQQLLMKYPLFLPLTRRRHTADKLTIVILGSGNSLVWILKNVIAAADLGRIRLLIHVFCEDAERLEVIFRTECPGLFSPEPIIPQTIPRFHTAPFDPLFFFAQADSVIDTTGADATHIPSILSDADYFIIDGQNEILNMDMAFACREYYLRSDISRIRIPFIAVRCESESIGRMAAGPSAQKNEASDLIGPFLRFGCYGDLRSLYSYISAGTQIENKAIEFNRQYHKETGDTDPRHADSQYWSRKYYRDSSRAAVIALPYRLYSAGFFFPDWEQYQRDPLCGALIGEFSKWLRSGTSRERDQKIESLAIEEHNRWCRFMLTRGWIRATPHQMNAYTQKGISSWKCFEAKMHPFICSWEELGEKGGDSTCIQWYYEQVLLQIAPEKTTESITDKDRAIIRFWDKAVGNE